MTDIVWPSDLVPFGVSFYSQPYSGGTQSPFTRQTKTYGLAAPRWIARFRIRGDDDGATTYAPHGPRIDALLARLRGRQNRVALFDYRQPIPRGAAAGRTLTAVANTAKGSTSITLAGALPSSVAFFDRDYLGFNGGHLVMAVSPATATAGGQVTVTFEPPLRRDIAAGEVVYVNQASAWFKLTSDDAGDNDAEIGQPTIYNLSFEEDL